MLVTSPQNKFVPGSSLSGEDDDEMESTGGTSPSDPGPHTTDAIDDFAKHVVSISAMPEEQESENDTATSAEVRIWGNSRNVPTYMRALNCMRIIRTTYIYG